MHGNTKDDRAVTTVTLVWFILMASFGIASADDSRPQPGGEILSEASDEANPLFATINGTEIALKEYVQVLRGTSRSTFYHGRPPEGDLETFRYEIGVRLMDSVLLEQEADRRGIEPDSDWIEERVAAMKERYADAPEFKEREDEILADLRDRLAQQSRISRLYDSVRDLPDGTDEQVREYYEAHPDQFSTPEQIRASVILLRVDPAAPREAWLAANEKAERLVFELAEGADFAELARLHSEDPSADEGGDLGFQHRGMLGRMAQAALDELEPGQNSGPVQLLDGIGILRLEERVDSKLNPLSAVRERAGDLWLREEKERVYERLIESLRERAEIEIHDPEYRRLVEKRQKEQNEGTGNQSIGELAEAD